MIQYYSYIHISQHLPTVLDGDNEGILSSTDEDRDVISSVGEHNRTLPLSAINACPSLHSCFPPAK